LKKTKHEIFSFSGFWKHENLPVKKLEKPCVSQEKYDVFNMDGKYCFHNFFALRRKPFGIFQIGIFYVVQPVLKGFPQV